ncbi:MAG TPA: hypothetical protein VNK07_00065 [Candidatus Binatia bacterium]|nr:hypothetical protein [Candidatus Binatia bacterium]
MYIYVINNPLNLTDPDGKKPKKIIDVFLTYETSKEVRAEWKQLQKEAAKNGVKINIYRIDNKTTTEQKFINSIMTKGRTTIVAGHSFTDGETYDKVLNRGGSMLGKGLGIEFNASTIVSKESIENKTAFGLTVDGKKCKSKHYSCLYLRLWKNLR